MAANIDFYLVRPDLIVLHKRQKSPQSFHILSIKKIFLNALRDWWSFGICAKFAAVKANVRPFPGRFRINQLTAASATHGRAPCCSTSTTLIFIFSSCDCPQRMKRSRDIRSDLIIADHCLGAGLFNFVSRPKRNDLNRYMFLMAASRRACSCFKASLISVSRL